MLLVISPSVCGTFMGRPLSGHPETWVLPMTPGTASLSSAQVHVLEVGQPGTHVIAQEHAL